MNPTKKKIANALVAKAKKANREAHRILASAHRSSRPLTAAEVQAARRIFAAAYTAAGKALSIVAASPAARRGPAPGARSAGAVTGPGPSAPESPSSASTRRSGRARR
jgi:hypothetical protein